MKPSHSHSTVPSHGGCKIVARLRRCAVIDAHAIFGKLAAYKLSPRRHDWWKQVYITALAYAVACIRQPEIWNSQQGCKLNSAASPIADVYQQTQHTCRAVQLYGLLCNLQHTSVCCPGQHGGCSQQHIFIGFGIKYTQQMVTASNSWT